MILQTAIEQQGLKFDFIVFKVTSTGSIIKHSGLQIFDNMSLSKMHLDHRYSSHDDNLTTQIKPVEFSGLLSKTRLLTTNIHLVGFRRLVFEDFVPIASVLNM